jgi:hypothetical protein
MITFIVFALAAVCALEVMLGLVLLGWAAVEFGFFLRRHPDGATGGLRELATGARRVLPATGALIAGRRVLLWRPRPGRSAPRAGRIRRESPGAVRRRTGEPATTRPRRARRKRVRG